MSQSVIDRSSAGSPLASATAPAVETKIHLAAAIRRSVLELVFSEAVLNLLDDGAEPQQLQSLLDRAVRSADGASR